MQDLREQEVRDRFACNDVRAHSSWDLPERCEDMHTSRFHLYRLTEDHNLVRGGQVETGAACHCRNQEDEDIRVLLEPVDHRHPYIASSTAGFAQILARILTIRLLGRAVELDVTKAFTEDV